MVDVSFLAFAKSFNHTRPSCYVSSCLVFFWFKFIRDICIMNTRFKKKFRYIASITKKLGARFKLRMY